MGHERVVSGRIEGQTQTLPLYAFLRAWSGANYGYGSALAVVLTFLLLAVVVTYAVRSAR